MKITDTLDSSEIDQLNERLASLFTDKAHKSWVMDLSGVEYLSSAMLGLLVNFRQPRCRPSEGGRLALCEISPRLMEIIRTCCMDRLFKIAKTRADAMKLVA